MRVGQGIQDQSDVEQQLLPRGQMDPVGVGYYSSEAVKQESVELERRGDAILLEGTACLVADFYLQIQMAGWSADRGGSSYDPKLWGSGPGYSCSSRGLLS